MDRIDAQIRQRQQEINKAIRASFKEDVTARPAVEMTEEAFEKAVAEQGLEVFTIEGLNAYKQELLKAIEGKKFPLDQLEKAAKNLGALQKVQKTDKNGKKITVYVKRGEDPKKEHPAAKPEAAGQEKEGGGMEMSHEHKQLIQKKSDLHKRVAMAIEHEQDPDRKAELMAHHTRLGKEVEHLSSGGKESGDPDPGYEDRVAEDRTKKSEKASKPKKEEDGGAKKYEKIRREQGADAAGAWDRQQSTTGVKKPKKDTKEESEDDPQKPPAQNATERANKSSLNLKADDFEGHKAAALAHLSASREHEKVGSDKGYFMHLDRHDLHQKMAGEAISRKAHEASFTAKDGQDHKDAAKYHTQAADHYSEVGDKQKELVHRRMADKHEGEARSTTPAKDAAKSSSGYQSHTNTAEEGRAVIARQRALLSNPKSPVGAKKRAQEIIDAESKKHGLNELGGKVRYEHKVKMSPAEMRARHEEMIYGKTGRSKAAKQRYMNEEERDRDNEAREARKTERTFSKEGDGNKAPKPGDTPYPKGSEHEWKNELMKPRGKKSTKAKKEGGNDQKPPVFPDLGKEPWRDAWKATDEAKESQTAESHLKAQTAHKAASDKYKQAGDDRQADMHAKQADRHYSLSKHYEMSEVGPKKTIESQGVKAMNHSAEAWGNQDEKEAPELHARAAESHKEAARLHREAGDEGSALYHDKKAALHILAQDKQKSPYDTKPGDSKAEKDKKNTDRLARMKELQGKLKSGKKGDDDDVEKAFDTLLG